MRCYVFSTLEIHFLFFKMNFVKVLIPFIGVSLLISLSAISCSRIPEPIGYDYSQQHKMQAGQHWDILAADIANEINKELIINDYLDTPVYIRETCGDENSPCASNKTTLFNESFRDLLISQLVNLGVPTNAVLDEKAIIVNYKAQTVFHQTNRVRTLRPGLLTAITAGIMVFRNAPAEMIAILTAGAIDFTNATYVQNGHFEVIITTSMIAKQRYLYRNSSIYYINDKDSWHYQQPGTPVEIELTAGVPETSRKSSTQLTPTSRNESPLPSIPNVVKPNATEI